MDLDFLLNVARKASSDASKAVMEVYSSDDFNVELKGDSSPLTKADKKSHEIIESHLSETGIPILSEEGAKVPYETRKNWETLWIVDPLDGTKEFVKRNGEFTVNIALVHLGKPILGVVEAPVLNTQYFGMSVKGAFASIRDTITSLKQIDEIDHSKSGLRVVASRSHLNDETKLFLGELNKPETVSMGSSLKFMLIAEGRADIYPRYAPTMEWDTAAAHAILSSLGGNVVDNSGRSLIYNKENLLNPYFKAF